MFIRMFKKVRAWEIAKGLSGPYSIAYILFGIAFPAASVILIYDVFEEQLSVLPPNTLPISVFAAIAMIYAILLMVDFKS